MSEPTYRRIGPRWKFFCGYIYNDSEIQFLEEPGKWVANYGTIPKAGIIAEYGKLSVFEFQMYLYPDDPYRISEEEQNEHFRLEFKRSDGEWECLDSRLVNCISLDNGVLLGTFITELDDVIFMRPEWDYNFLYCYDLDKWGYWNSDFTEVIGDFRTSEAAIADRNNYLNFEVVVCPGAPEFLPDDLRDTVLLDYETNEPRNPISRCVE